MPTDLLHRLQDAVAGRYRIARELGAGGTAVVFLAEDLRHRRPVAVKVLRPDLGLSVGPTRFLREIEIVARLSHPHILPLFDSGAVDALLYFVMPCVEGESLRERLRREGRLPLEEALRLAREVLDALDYAHGRCVVHRDIKPGNIFLTGGHALLGDFGIAHAACSPTEERVTETGLAIGTPAYMSPEQALGSDPIDGRSDLYAVGCVLYEMLAGEPPFSGPTAQAILAKSLTQLPPSLEERHPGVPEPLARAVQKALSKKPEDRFETAARFAQALLAVSEEEVRSGGAAPPLEPRARPAASTGEDAAGETHLFSPTAVAVFPFTVRGRGEFRYLGEGMVDLLGTKIDGAGGLRSVDPRALLGFLAHRGGAGSDPEDVRASVAHFRAKLYILGSVLEAGGRLQLHATLYDAEGATASRGDVLVPGEARLFEGVDELARQLLAGLLGGRGARLEGIAALTTESIPALKAYLEGEHALRKGRFTEALEGYRRAVDLDRTFALAYHRLSIAAEWTVRGDVARAAAEQAVRHSVRLSEHDRLLLEASLAWRRGAAAEAERLYRGILYTYPDDLEAWFQLGEVVFHYGPWRGRAATEAKEPFERVLAFEPDHASALLHLARLAAKARDGEKVSSLVERYLALAPEGERASEMEALRAFALEDGRKQEATIERLRGASDVVVYVATFSVALWAGRREGGLRLAGLLTEPSRPARTRAIGLGIRGHLLLSAGRWKAAQSDFVAAEALHRGYALRFRSLSHLLPMFPVSKDERERCVEALASLEAPAEDSAGAANVFLDPDHGAHDVLHRYLLGVLGAHLGRPEEAEEAANELDRRGKSPSEGAFALDLARRLRGWAAWQRGALSEALSILERNPLETWYELGIASPIRSQARERFLRAELLEALDRPEEALLGYGSFADSSLFDLVYEAPSHLRRGHIRERLGEPAKAIEHYRRFAELWRDADAELHPAVEEAERRRVALESARPTDSSAP